MSRKFAIVALLILMNATCLLGQDAQSSHSYWLPMHLNPSLTGTSELSLGYFNYRIQYPEIAYPYISSRFAIDYAMHQVPSAIGFIVTSERSGAGNLNRTDIGATYAYFFNVNKEWEIRTGVKASAVFQSTQFSQYLFGDQISSDGTFSGNTSENLSAGENLLYPDFSLGALAHNNAAFFGLAVDHITTPNQSFFGGDSRLPRKYTFHGGYKFSYINANGRIMKGLKEFSITPMGLFQIQGPAKKLELGLELLYEPILIGFWYRGIPIGNNQAGFFNQEPYKASKAGWPVDWVFS